jgi:N-acetylmuramoyl-L-alanine amidase
VPRKFRQTFPLVLACALGVAIASGGATRNWRAAIQQSAPPALDTLQSPLSSPAPGQSSPTLNVVVLDPAHGGSDLGARGATGIDESAIVLDFARAIRASLEATGLRVVQTRIGDDGPSFDDRSTTANAQRGAVFISLHVSSTGPNGQVRVYSEPPPNAMDATAPIAPGALPLSFPYQNGMLPWDKAQMPYAAASRKLAELAQAALAKKFSGSPGTPLYAPVRQLRTVAAPAIAIEVSSVSVAKREDLLQMTNGLADCVAQSVAAFRPIYQASAH